MSNTVMILKTEIESVMFNVACRCVPQVGCELEEKFWLDLQERMMSISRS